MKKVLLLAVCMAAIVVVCPAQGRKYNPEKVLDEVERLLEEEAYKTAYERAEGAFEYLLSKGGKGLLRAAYYMERAAVEYQNDAPDSAEARYRRILPHLDSVERAMCLWLMGKPEEALRDTALLKNIPVEQVRYLCSNTSQKGLNTTPTVYDLIMEQCAQGYDNTDGIAYRKALLAHHRQMLSLACKQEHTGVNSAVQTEQSLVIYHELILLRHQEQEREGSLSGIPYALQCLDRCRGYKSEMLTSLYAYIANLYNQGGCPAKAKAYCDTAIKLYPKSYGSVLCFNLRAGIITPRVEITMCPNTPCGREGLFAAEVKNAEVLYYRVVRKPEKWDEKDAKALLQKAEVIYENTVSLERHNDYLPHSVAGVLPSLPAGEYVLMATYRHDGFIGKGAFVAYTFQRSDVEMTYSMATNGGGMIYGYLLHTTDGSPAQNVPVTLYIRQRKPRSNNYEYTVADSVRTDAQGRYRFTGVNLKDKYKLEATSQGMTHSQYLYGASANKNDDTVVHVFFDRPVYRPGDTLRFVYIVSEMHANGDIGVMPDVPLAVALLDPRHDEVMDTLTATTDDFGRATGTFVLSKDVTPGNYCLTMEGKHVSLTRCIAVEAYKQPTFTVAMQEKTAVTAFGDTVHIDGVAQTYTEAPMNNVTVQYSVKRTPGIYFWWRKGIIPYNSYMETLVTTGTVTTDADGHFDIAFVPEPDTNDPRMATTAYRYTVIVTVTDAAGESYEQRLTLRIGYENRALGISGITRNMDTLHYRYCDLNEHPLAANVSLKIERLRQPTEAKVIHPVIAAGLTPPMGREEFARRFPQYYYTRQEGADCYWEMQGLPLTLTATSGEVDNSIVLPKLKPGVFRLILTVDGMADTVWYTHNPLWADKPQGVQILFCKTDKGAYHVGETVTLRVGSRHKGLHCIAMLTVGDSLAEEQTLTLNDNIRTLQYTITPEMRYKTPTVCIYALKEGESERLSFELTVTNTEKRMDVKLNTFRDYLEPGEQEVWDIAVATTGTPMEVPATLMMTMYDKALDSYRSGNIGWDFAPLPRVGKNWNLSTIGYWNRSMIWMPEIVQATYNEEYFAGWTPWRNPYRIGVLRSRYDMMYGTEDAAYRQMSHSKSAGLLETVVADEQPHVRINGSTLAFFEPALQFDTARELHYQFRAPDLLTQWRIEGLAWTADMHFGRLQKSLVTRKQLMIQPNMPRYVREGDNILLSARVTNMTDGNLVVDVTFDIEGEGTPQGTLHATPLTLPAHATQSVAFAIDSTQLPKEQASIRWTATASQHSDAVVLPLTVLSDRMTVTQSHALYQNGTGKKSYTVPMYTSPTAEPEALTVEYTSNPFWLAMEALPHLADKSDPSNINLFNRLYCSTLGKSEADVALAKELGKTLEERQLSDGGWSWMPQGVSGSDYVTRYILKGYGRMLATHRITAVALDYASALSFIDSMATLRYKEASKDKSYTLTATDIDYLYTRSFYLQRNVAVVTKNQAYTFYYDKGQKQYSKVSGLYEQALLALVLHRGGNTKEAQELVYRLKEKSLVSDEMGMYWRDNKAGCYWHQRPVETQALLIQAFREVTPQDRQSVDLMRLWLLKQKQTTRWDSDVATAHAITALLGDKDYEAKETVHTDVTLSNGKHQLAFTTPDSAEGHFRHTLTGDSLAWLTATRTLELTLQTQSRDKTPSPTWGAVFYQYKEDMDKIPYLSTGIDCQSELYVLRADGTLKAAADTALAVGMRLRRVLTFSTDRVMEYVEVSDGRAACLEPVSTTSGWQWQYPQEGVKFRRIGYFLAVGDQSTDCYIERLEKGHYRLESDCYITHEGLFVLAPVVMQCLYAPEFRVVTPAEKLSVTR